MNSVIIFLRHPTPGKTKTRLIPALGAEGACDFYRSMAEHIFKALAGPDIVGYVEPPERIDAVRDWLGRQIDFQPQASGDLGARLSSAFEREFARGRQKVIAIGTDCPAVTRSVVDQAFNQLETHDAVIGPSTDGGYYLLGLSRFIPQAFDNIPWSTEDTYRETKLALVNVGASMTDLAQQIDIDTAEDIDQLDQTLADTVNGWR